MSDDEICLEVALEIYRAFTHEQDPKRARHRFERLKHAVRESFINEARLAIAKYERLKFTRTTT